LGSVVIGEAPARVVPHAPTMVLMRVFA
jgi:hypothetical protein